MLSAKQWCSLCSGIVFNEFNGRHSIISSKIIREYATKNSKSRNKNGPQITIKAKNDFVTHQLNSSIAAHLKRQDKIWNKFQKEEQEECQMRKTDYYFNKNTGKLEQTQYHGMGKNEPTDKYSKKKYPNNGHDMKINRRVRTISDEAKHDEDGSSDIDSDDYSLDELETPNWEDMQLIEINKKFYKPSEPTQSRSPAEISEFQSKMHIQIGANAPNPIFKFTELNDLSQQIIAKFHEKHFHECTPIQAQAIPIALSGSNMIAISQPRSGKTLAMILSAIIHISHQSCPKPEGGPIAIVLTLTQEMAEQIQQLANVFCNDVNIKCTVLCNDTNQSQEHTTPIDVGELLITTPCHLYEILRTKSINLQRCSHFAIYEADKMLHMCLNDEILQIESQIRPNCQRIIWSSAWTSEMKKLIVDDHVRLDVGSSAVEQNLSENIKQIVRVSDEKHKDTVLIDIVNLISSESMKKKTLIFTETPNKADRLANILKRKGFHCRSLHNRNSEVQQNAILSEFQNETFSFLVLTDLAAKNINFSKISNVVSFDMPFSISDYVNRVSRTDRVGISYAIITEEDGDIVDDLIATLQQSKQTINPSLFIMSAANADSEDEISFAVPKGRGYQKYTIDKQSEEVKIT